MSRKKRWISIGSHLINPKYIIRISPCMETEVEDKILYGIQVSMSGKDKQTLSHMYHDEDTRNTSFEIIARKLL